MRPLPPLLLLAACVPDPVPDGDTLARYKGPMPSDTPIARILYACEDEDCFEIRATASSDPQPAASAVWEIDGEAVDGLEVVFSLTPDRLIDVSLDVTDTLGQQSHAASQIGQVPLAPIDGEGLIPTIIIDTLPCGAQTAISSIGGCLQSGGPVGFGAQLTAPQGVTYGGVVYHPPTGSLVRRDGADGAAWRTVYGGNLSFDSRYTAANHGTGALFQPVIGPMPTHFTFWTPVRADETVVLTPAHRPLTPSGPQTQAAEEQLVLQCAGGVVRATQQPFDSQDFHDPF
jgi:hypothetical protein